MVWVSVVPVLPLLALSLLFEGPERDAGALAGFDWSGAGALVYVAWLSTVFGFGAWGMLLRRYPASSVAPFSLLVPVFGMSSAAVLLGEPVTPLRWAAAALLVGGVALTSLVRPTRSGRGAPGMPGPRRAVLAGGGVRSEGRSRGGGWNVRGDPFHPLGPY
ncbi:membrane protein [Streptomyces xanthochromogenes]